MTVNSKLFRFFWWYLYFSSIRFALFDIHHAVRIDAFPYRITVIAQYSIIIMIIIMIIITTLITMIMIMIIL